MTEGDLTNRNKEELQKTRKQRGPRGRGRCARKDTEKGLNVELNDVT